MSDIGFRRRRESDLYGYGGAAWQKWTEPPSNAASKPPLPKPKFAIWMRRNPLPAAALILSLAAIAIVLIYTACNCQTGRYVISPAGHYILDTQTGRTQWAPDKGDPWHLGVHL